MKERIVKHKFGSTETHKLGIKQESNNKKYNK